MQIISTSTAYNTVLSNLMTAETREGNISAQVSSGENATDLQGYASNAETLIAMQTVQSQVTGFISTGQVLTAKLSSQATGLSQVGDAITSASSAVTNALAAGSGDDLMASLQSAFNNAVQGMNTTFNGQYVFGGGQVTTAPVTATQLSDLTAAPSIASLFNNDQVIQSAQVNQNTTLPTGILASSIGTPLFNVLQTIEAYNQGPNGPLTGTLTAAQTTFLQGQITALTNASNALNTVSGQNGLVQSEVASTQTDLNNQQTSLQTMSGDITNTNMAQAASNLQQAQLAIQASAKVFAALESSSLVTLLPTG
jgi:flagellar hook-associated protein 3 FlgL